jgi:hypothetical protein
VSEAKYVVGQVVVYKGKKDIPVRILEVMLDRIDRKNFLHEPMLRALSVEEKGA